MAPTPEDLSLRVTGFDGDARYIQDDPGDDEMRTATERDVDRLTYSSELRRLTSVTQVVSPRTDQQIHNRLTHTLKVGQLGRRIAQRFLDAVVDGDLDVAAVEAACLAHDLGHPPFGHVGEQTLDRLCTNSGLSRFPGVTWEPIPEGFEGNAQSFRILTRLARRGRTKGLDLTVRTLNAAVKYPWKREGAGSVTHRLVRQQRKLNANSKWCVYLDDEPVFGLIWKHHTGGHVWPSLEASIMEIADDITYAVHDLFDFYRAGFVPLASIFSNDASDARERLKIWWSNNLVCDDVSEDDALARFKATLDEMRFLVVNVPDEYHVAPYDAERWVAESTNGLIGRLVHNVELFGEEGGSLVADFAGERERDLVELMQGLTRTFVIDSPSLGLVQAGQELILEDLFVGLMRDAARTSPRLLPENMRADPGTIELTRHVRDFVAGLTEPGAQNLHALLTGRGASAFDSMLAQGVV